MEAQRRPVRAYTSPPPPYGPALGRPPPAPLPPLPGSATKPLSSLISSAAASTPPFPLLHLHPIPLPRPNARSRSLVYAKSLLPLLMFSTLPYLLYLHPALPRIRASPLPHAHSLSHLPLVHPP